MPPRKPLSEQSRRFIERADEIGAEATEDEFSQVLKRLVPPAGAPQASTTERKGKSVRRKLGRR